MANSAAVKSASQYRRPELKVYGSVRNLTGGSSGSMNDGTGVMTIQSRFFPGGKVN